MLTNSKYSVIIVDDEDDMLSMFTYRLKKWYDVVSFSSAKEMLDNIDLITPCLFVLDWMLPEMDGITLCKKIREEHKFDLVPIAFYTSIDPTIENMRTAFEAGAETFISKGQSSYFLLANIKTLVEGYCRMMKYLQQRQLMLSVLKHDIANYATCLTTGVEVISMSKAFEESDMQKQFDPILSSSKKLKLLFEDLKEVLVTDNRNFNETVSVVRSKNLFKELNSHLDGLEREVLYTEPDIEEIMCDPSRFCRCLYYIVMFIDKHVPPRLPVVVELISCEDKPVFRIIVTGDFKKSLEDAMYVGTVADADSRHDFLFVNYIENVLSWHKTRMSFIEDKACTGVTFVLPQEKSIEHRA